MAVSNPKKERARSFSSLQWETQTSQKETKWFENFKNF